MPSSLFEDFPNVDELIDWSKKLPHLKPVISNMHIHTPYSFSAFENINEAVALAKQQDVLILGISDFNTTEGYDKFTDECLKSKIFPVYGMETIALSVEDQKANIRWNDPNNPGRIYFCGKGFQYPVDCSQKTNETLKRITQSLECQIHQMIDKMNEHLKKTLPDINLSYEYIRDNMTEGTVRERHLAKALEQIISKTFIDLQEKARALKSLYGKDSKVNIADSVSLQEEIRTNLIKAGGVAFVEESPSAYLDIEEAKSIMLDMGGIPCYPVLLDGTKGKPTEFESDPELLCDELIKRDIYCAEFIPTRNDINLLREYVSVFNRKGIILTAGTEHNTPKMEPMVPMCRNGVKLDGMLMETFYKGACVVSAHQYLVKRGQKGYVDKNGTRNENIDMLESIGEAVIAYYLFGNLERTKDGIQI